MCYLCSAHRHRLSIAACLPVHTAALDRLVRADLPPFSRPPLPIAVSQTACSVLPSRLHRAQCCFATFFSRLPTPSAARQLTDVSRTALPPAPRSAALQTSAARRCLEPLADGMLRTACAPASGTVPLRPSQHRRSYGLDHTTALTTVFCCAGVHFAARVLGPLSVSIAVQPACSDCPAYVLLLSPPARTAQCQPLPTSCYTGRPHHTAALTTVS